MKSTSGCGRRSSRKSTKPPSVPRRDPIRTRPRLAASCTRRIADMTEMNILEAIRSAMDAEMERDERVMVMGEDVGRKGGVFGATDGLWARFGESRFLDTPLAESAIVGVAIGAALNGLIPIAERQFADFIPPAFRPGVREAPLPGH